MSSLPSQTGIGNLGAGARKWIDFLSESGFKVWQICPLGPTGYGDSPYQCFSAFAGNAYFIDLESLVGARLLDEADIEPLRALPRDRVDYGRLYAVFWSILEKAHLAFRKSGADCVGDYGSLEGFRETQSAWLPDYALYQAIKKKNNGSAWTDWPPFERAYSKAKRSA